MLFTSLEFLLFFLPIALGAFLVARSFRSLSLVVATLIVTSLGLYASSEPSFLPVMLASVALTYIIARLIHGHRGKLANGLCTAGVLLNLVPFVFFKYVSVGNTGDTAVAAWAAHTIPLGISFFTFQQIAYLFDVRRGTVPPVGFGKYCLFVLFFPHLIAGPIVRHNELIGQFTTQTFSRSLQTPWACAVSLFAIGLLKKVVVADNLARYVNPSLEQVALGAQPGVVEAWSLMLAAAAQIYYDYSAYGDMALALALCFGLHLPISFYSPYQATSVADFWRRWNMTLMRFFRDHIYIPLGGNRHGRMRQLFAILVTMVACGVWHGAGGNFVFWGALVAALIGIELIFRDHTRISTPPTLGRAIASRVLVLAAYVGPLTFFIFPDMEQSFTTLRGMAGINGVTLPVWSGAVVLEPGASQALMPGRVDIVLLMGAWAGIYLLPNTYQIFRAELSSPWTDPALSGIETAATKQVLAWRPTWAWALASAALLSLGLSTLGGDAAKAFYYFRF